MTARDEEFWAKPVSSLHIQHELPAEALNLNVEGHRLAPLAGGFGKMWQKTYRIRLDGADVTPQDVVKVWKSEFPTFWLRSNRFYRPISDISPGDVALINLRAGGLRLSTGILVLYADDESFSFMTPEGHMFAGMITFSAHEAEGTTVAQIHLFIRAQDPATELAMTLGGHALEDWNWMKVLHNVAARFGVDAKATKHVVCVDRKRRWSEWRNITRNAGLRSLRYALATPLRTITGSFRSRG